MKPLDLSKFFTDFLHKRVSDTPIKEYWENKKVKKYSSPSSVIYESYPEHGFCLLLKPPKTSSSPESIDDSSFVIDSIFVYFNDPKRYRKFEGKIPYNLSVKMVNAEFVEFLGEPFVKQGGKIANIGLNWKSIGVEAEFYCKTWDVGDAPLAWLCFYDFKADLDQKLAKN